MKLGGAQRAAGLGVQPAHGAAGAEPPKPAVIILGPQLDMGPSALPVWDSELVTSSNELVIRLDRYILGYQAYLSPAHTTYDPGMRTVVQVVHIVLATISTPPETVRTDL